MGGGGGGRKGGGGTMLSIADVMLIMKLEDGENEFYKHYSM